MICSRCSNELSIDCFHLHVPWNLQILPEDINYAKSNTFTISD